MNFDMEQKVTVSPEVLFQEVSGEIVLLDLDTESYFGLDEVGTRIWQLLNEGVTVNQAVDRLVEEYAVERKQLESDVVEFITRLGEAGLVRL